MIPFAGADSEPSALKLDCFASGIFHLVCDGGDHHHQHTLVNISLLSCKTPLSPGEEVAERAME
jgi:hypothetical protein